MNETPVIKEENEKYILEEDIKIEESSPEYCGSEVSCSGQEPPCPLIIEKELPVCSMCKAIFERTSYVKIHQPSDNFKCNKCILHSRLNQVISTNPFKSTKQKSNGVKKRQRGKTTDLLFDVIKNESVTVKKILFLCQSCGKTFERKESVKFHEAADLYKCNKCILHTRLNTVFNKSIQGVSK